MSRWSETDMAAVLAAAVEQLTPVKRTSLLNENRLKSPNSFEFEVQLRNGQVFVVEVAEKRG